MDNTPKLLECQRGRTTGLLPKVHGLFFMV